MWRSQIWSIHTKYIAFYPFTLYADINGPYTALLSKVLNLFILYHDSVIDYLIITQSSS